MAKDYWFFLSYARNDAKDDPWLRRFYERLARRLSQVLGLLSTLEPEDVGFFDVEGIPPGDKWDEALLEALQSSKAFVCLYSASYFNSRVSSQEFEVFRSRVEEYAKAKNLPRSQWPRLVIPVLWDLPTTYPKPLPEAVADLQYTHADFGDLYAEKGLAHLIKNRRASAYEGFLDKLCLCLKEETKAHAVPRLQNPPPLKQVVDAFHPAPVTPPSPPKTVPADATLPRGMGPRFAWFVYAVGRKQDYQGIQRSPASYDDQDVRGWLPYLPPPDAVPVGLIAQGVATAKRLQCETVPLTARLVEHLRTADESNTVAVVIVDPWSIRLPAYKTSLEALNNQNLTNCGVIVIWNEEDPETMQQANALHAEISKMFLNTLVNKQIYLRGFRRDADDGVNSEEKLKEELRKAIDELRAKIDSRNKLLQQIQPAGAGSLPIIPVPKESPA